MKAGRILPAVAFLLFVWYGLRWIGAAPGIFLPYPHTVLLALIRGLTAGSLARDLAATTIRIAVAFAFSLVLGVVFGLLVAGIPAAAASGEFLIDFFRSLPAMALFPLFLILFGLGDVSKVATAVFAAAAVVALHAIYGVRNTPQTRKLLGQVIGASPWEIFRKITVPSALPQIFVGLRIALSLVVVVIVVTEMFVGTSEGIGHTIFQAGLVYNIATMYAAIVLVGLLGYLLNRGFVVLENRLLYWYQD